MHFVSSGSIPILPDVLEASAETVLQHHPNLQGPEQYLPDAHSICACTECLYITNTAKFHSVCDA